MALVAFASCSLGKVSGETDFNDVGKVMVGMLENKHFAEIKFDEEMSDRILSDFLKDLDPARLYFTQDDVDGFEARFGGQAEAPIHQLLVQERAMEPAGEIYSRYVERVRERIDFAKKIAEEGEFDFGKDETVMRSRREAPWPADDFEAQELWRKQIKEEILSEEMRRETIRRIAEEQGKEDPLKDDKSPREAVKQRYERFLKDIEGADEEDVASYFFSAVAQAHDPHTDYLSVRQMERFRAGLENQLIGIGALLQREDDGATKIIGLVVNGPADKQGELQLNDRIVAVDSLNDGEFTDTLYMKIDHVVELIRGQQDTEVRLKVEPAGGAPGEVKEIIIKRDKVELKDEAAAAEIIEMVQEDGSTKSIGWITLPSFYLNFNTGVPSVYRDVQVLLTRLMKEGVDGVALDLRGNGGGALEEVRRMTGLFVGRGPVVQVKEGWGAVRVKESTLRKPLYEGPLLVVTDKTSASASEILAGALQDYNRAIVVGESSTYGKGTVQQPMDIGRFFKFFQDSDRAGTLKATVQKFYRVTGSSTQLDGVVPDIVLPSLTDALEIGEEFQDHALPHDLIEPAKGFAPLERDGLFLPEIAARSNERVANSKDFQYVQEDVARTKKRIEENVVSLNRKVREQELQEAEERRDARNEERRERFSKIEQRDSEKFNFYRLTLDDLEREALEEVDRKRDAEANMRVAKDEVADLDDTPEWPSGLDVVKRESIHILTDLIELTEKAAVANLDEKAEAQAQ
ncbi:carboxy terminal-processing peptidase [Roseibacillus ishigakijimensis]|uniref:Carboxy terminal-processing peptidase n=2 Tax=Roseibacillus ishigakijimensis TaxID=454146 RepID=A0A934RPP7_9BACT|nr:carboxy terminal-processing peptidase [Roseibacillus ishigakijimensis]